MTRAVRRRRPPRRAVLIVCEGQNTEPRHFDRLVKALSLAATVTVEIHGAPGCTDPQGLVDFALDKLRERKVVARDDLTKAELEEVWVAIPSAVQAALRQGLGLSISSPSFEVWYVLHDRPTPPGLSRSADALPVLARLVGRALDKSRASADALAEWAMPHTATALRHGERQDVFEGEPSRTSAHVPSTTGTGVHFLGRSLVAMSSDAAGKRQLGFLDDTD